MTIGLGGHNK